MNIAKFSRTAFLWNTSRSSHLQMLQMFFKIGVLESFPNFTGKHLCWSLFFKRLQAEGLQLYLKSLQLRCFPVKFEIFNNIFLQNTSGDCFCTSGGCFCIFFKKVIKQLLLFCDLVMMY